MFKKNNLVTLFAVLSFLILSCSSGENEVIQTEKSNETNSEKKISEDNKNNDAKAVPYVVKGRSVDIEFDGSHIWIAHYEDSIISKVDLEGKTIGSYEVQGEPIKLTFDGEYMWVAHFTEPIVSKLSLDGEIIGVYDTGESPGGIFRDGEDIWVANGMSNF